MSSFLTIFLLAALVTACPFASLVKDPEMRKRFAGHELEKQKLQAVARDLMPQVAPSDRKRALKEEDVVREFELSSVLKGPESAVFNRGFRIGFAVDGVQTPELEVIAGNTYRFRILSACNHPFYLSADVRGQGNTPINDGFDTPPQELPLDQQICANRTILWRPSEALIGKEIWYQCTKHLTMGNIIKVRAETLCEKYHRKTRLTFANQLEMMKSIVSNIVARVVSPVNNGEDNLVLEYFDGTIVQPDFTGEDNPNVPKLIDGLVSFFGDALECSDNSILPYTGPSMKEVHKDMPISKFEYDAFNEHIAFELEKIMEPADLDAVIALLNSNVVRGEICNVDPTCIETICSKYSIDAANDPNANKNLVTTIVTKTVEKIGASSVLKPFFDGTVPPGSTDFFGDSTKLDALGASLVSFFGRSDVLACPQPNFPPSTYEIGDLRETHASMPITKPVFDAFNQAIEDVAVDLGVDSADVKAIRDLLDSTEPLICNQPGCAGIANVDQQFVISIAKKEEGHHFFGQGNPVAYTIDGEHKEGLVLEVGKKYSFRVDNACSHPFYLSVGTGSGSDEIDAGIIPAGKDICIGRTVEFTPTEDQVGKTLFFACRIHNFMGGNICIARAGQAGSTACNTAKPNLADLTPCDELTTAVLGGTNTKKLGNSNDILRSIVVDLFTAGVGEDVPLRKYFDGEQPIGSTNFITDLSAQGKLVDKLVSFFGEALQCSDGSVPPVEKRVDMKVAHQFMDISKDDFDLFNTVLLGLLADVAKDGDGIKSPKNTGLATAFLKSSSTDICAGCPDYAGPTICQKWSTGVGLKQDELLREAVVATFTTLVGPNSLSKGFFDGSIPCNDATDFVKNKLNQFNLVEQLVAFFGQKGVLGCTDSAFPKYRGSQNMELVHQNMPITKEIFDEFTNALAGAVTTLLGEAVPSLEADLGAVVALFATPGVSVICNQPGCPGKVGKFVDRCPVSAVPEPMAPEPESDAPAEPEEPSSEMAPNGEEGEEPAVQVDSAVVAGVSFFAVLAAAVSL